MQLSVFPYLLSFEQLSPVLIRLVLGAILAYWSYKGLRQKNTSSMNKLLAALEGVLGLLLILGLWTQVAALVAAVGLVVMIIQQIRTKSFMNNGVNYTLILLVLALSLLVTGPGWWAFDYPL